jgi:pyruvate-formate lyase-activating enzyme
VHHFLRGTPLEQLSWLRERGYPDATLLALHNACAQACFFCAGPGTTGVPDAERTPVAAALAQLRARPQGVTTLLVGGNEPTLHPDFDRLLAEVPAAGFRRVELMTNGARLAGHSEGWARLGLAEVVVPLYSAEAGVHDAVVGAPSWGVVTAGLDAARAAGVSVRVHTLLLRQNLDGLEALARLVRERWGSRLGVALLRDKGSFGFVASAPALPDLVSTLARIPPALRPVGIGTPACIPTAPEPPALVAELYFRTQARRRGTGCARCADAACTGLVSGYEDAGIARSGGVDHA